MSLAAEYTAAQDPTFVQRCQMAAIAFAVLTIEGESSNTPNHQNRALYAQRLVANPAAYAGPLAQGVVALNAVSDGSSLDDTTVQNSVAAIWDIYAGILS